MISLHFDGKKNDEKIVMIFFNDHHQYKLTKKDDDTHTHWHRQPTTDHNQLRMTVITNKFLKSESNYIWKIEKIDMKCRTIFCSKNRYDVMAVVVVVVIIEDWFLWSGFGENVFFVVVVVERDVCFR